MATSKQLMAEYLEFIGRVVVDKFGVSYQIYETDGKSWRQQLKYRDDVADFIMLRTNLFLRLLSERDQSNFNMMYKVCDGIAEHLSKYFSKKSPDLTRKVVAGEILDKIFLQSPRMINKFNNVYRKPIDLSNTAYVASNPGIIAMYKSILSRQH